MVPVGRGGCGMVMPAGCSTAGRPAVHRHLRAGEGALEQGDRAGVPQGDWWQLQDMLVDGLGAGFAKWLGWWPCPWHGRLGLGFGVMGMLARVQNMQGQWGEVLDTVV